jgi:predicted ester cyclase
MRADMRTHCSVAGALRPSLVVWLACVLVIGAVPRLAAAADEAAPVSTTAPISLDQKKSLSRRSLEMWASDNADVPEEVFAEDYVNHQEPDAAGGVKSLNLAGWKAVVGDTRRAFSDFQVEILMQIAEGDLVATRWRFTAVNTGAYLGHPPTGKRAAWTGVQIDRFAGGKIVESWVDWDKYRLFAELGYLQ